MLHRIGAFPGLSSEPEFVHALGRAKVVAPAPVHALGRTKLTPVAAAAAAAPSVAVTLAPASSSALAAKAAAAPSNQRMSRPRPASSSGGCGPEPERKSANASGAAQYADGAAGVAWLACMDRTAGAKQAERIAALDAHALGGPNGCGPEPAFALAASGQKFYSGDGGREVGAAWNRCMQSAPAADARPASTGGAASRPVELVPQSVGPSDEQRAADEQRKLENLTKSPLSVSGSVDVPTEMWIGLGILGAATVLGSIYLATRHK